MSQSILLGENPAKMKKTLQYLEIVHQHKTFQIRQNVHKT